ncbi:MAG: cysteine-rich CWC family protein [Polyangiales bacterium]
MIDRSDPNDPRKCPLCGMSNECAVAEGQDADSCWCMTATMSAVALAAIPREAQGKVCICAKCASGSPSND